MPQKLTWSDTRHARLKPPAVKPSDEPLEPNRAYRVWLRGRSLEPDDGRCTRAVLEILGQHHTGSKYLPTAFFRSAKTAELQNSA
jgi:hypothetical protein